MTQVQAGRQQDATLANLLRDRARDIAEIWVSLGEDSPTFGSPDAGSPEAARQRYLYPLARLLVRAVCGAEQHAAIYFDERLRYLDGTLADADREEALRTAMRAEFPRISALFRDRAESAALEAALWRFHAPLFERPVNPVKLLYIGDCLFVETRAFLMPLLRKSGNQAAVRQIFFSARQQVDAPNGTIVRAISEYKPHIVGLSLFSYEGMPPYMDAWRRASSTLKGKGALRSADGLIDIVRQTLDDIRSVSDVTVAVHAPGGVPLARFRAHLPFVRAHSPAQRRLLVMLTDGLAELVSATSNTVLLHESGVVKELGGARAAGKMLFEETDVPPAYFHPRRLGPALAQAYADVVTDYVFFGRAKALLVDFDNTLWRGVMAEGAVNHDERAQRLLLELKRAGVLLIAVSKNDARSIRWEEMILKESDFVITKVNWRPKPDNVAEAIEQLNISPSAVVLLDDNPVERALVTEQVSGVRAVDPAAPETWRALQRWLDFPSTTMTAEASRRTAMYREAAERRAAMSPGHDYDTMMRSLKLQYRVRRAQRQDRERLVELIQRTNQYNTTTRRWSVEEIDARLADEGIAVFVATLRDRFGDLGVVAAAVFDRTTRTFEAAVMSCRAMGFGLEMALLRTVIDTESDGRPFYGLFIPTERNAPAAELFRTAGFREGERGIWTLPGDARAPDIPAWLSCE